MKSITRTINGGRGYTTYELMRARYRRLGFRMPRGKYKVTYKLHPNGNLIFLGYPNQPVQLPTAGNYWPLIILNNRSVCFLPVAWDLKRLVRTVKVL